MIDLPKVLWTPTHPLGKLLPPAHPGDAGLDLVAVESHTLSPLNHGHGAMPVACGIRIALPEGTCALIVGRSSAALANLTVLNTLIDAGYRGPLFALVINLNPTMPAQVKIGDRIAQLLLLPAPIAQHLPQQVEELPSSARGEQGFGSTGGTLQTVATPSSSDEELPPQTRALREKWLEQLRRENLSSE